MARRDPRIRGLEEKIDSFQEEAAGLEYNKAVISFEDAWQRELEYRQRIKLKSLKSSLDSELLPTTQELPPKAADDRRKKKLVIPSTPIEKESPTTQKGGELCQFYQASSQNLNFRLQLLSPRKPSLLPSPEDVQHQTSQDSNYQQGSFHQNFETTLPNGREEFKYQEPSRKQTTEQHLQTSSGQIVVIPIKCEICDVPCMNDLNYEQHCLGKKHKAKWEKLYGNSIEIEMKKHKILLCSECNITCVNEFALAQHLSGKKHAFRLLELQKDGGPTFSKFQPNYT